MICTGIFQIGSDKLPRLICKAKIKYLVTLQRIMIHPLDRSVVTGNNTISSCSWVHLVIKISLWIMAKSTVLRVLHHADGPGNFKKTDTKFRLVVYKINLVYYKLKKKYSIQFIYLCNEGLWLKVQIQVLTFSAIHGVLMLLIYIWHLLCCYSSIDKIVLKMVE